LKVERLVNDGDGGARVDVPEGAGGGEAGFVREVDGGEGGANVGNAAREAEEHDGSRDFGYDGTGYSELRVESEREGLQEGKGGAQSRVIGTP
jgi:hypothetical protein